MALSLSLSLSLCTLVKRIPLQLVTLTTKFKPAAISKRMKLIRSPPNRHPPLVVSPSYYHLAVETIALQQTIYTVPSQFEVVAYQCATSLIDFTISTSRNCIGFSGVPRRIPHAKDIKLEAIHNSLMNHQIIVSYNHMEWNAANYPFNH